MTQDVGRQIYRDRIETALIHHRRFEDIEPDLLPRTRSEQALRVLARRLRRAPVPLRPAPTLEPTLEPTPEPAFAATALLPSFSPERFLLLWHQAELDDRSEHPWAKSPQEIAAAVLAAAGGGGQDCLECDGQDLASSLVLYLEEHKDDRKHDRKDEDKAHPLSSSFADDFPHRARLLDELLA